MATTIVMPTLGLTMTEGSIESWYVQVGDTVNKGDVVADIGSEKLTGPVESPVDGVVLKLFAKEGDVLPIKEAMLIIGEAGESIEDEAAETGTDAGEGTGSGAAQETGEASTGASGPSTNVSTTGTPRPEGERIFATPLARKMASERGIDLSDVNGTGGNQRITRLDIERYVPSPAVQASSPVSQSVDAPAWGEGLSGMRKTIAQRMMRSVQTTAQVTNQRKVDVTRLMTFRQEIKAQVGEPLTKGEISINTLVTKAVILALKEHPSLNAWYHNGVHEVQEAVHIGMATDVENGLVVPVVMDADKLSLARLGQTITDVASQARQGTLAGNLYSGSTFTITNLGGSNIEYFTPIINLPEVAILGVGTLMDELVLDSDGDVVTRKQLPLSLTYDHQIIDGAPAAKFLETLSDLLNNPYKLIL